MKSNVRPSAVSGQFYPADPEELKNDIKGYLKNVRPTTALNNLRALIVPHAGYLYSGPVAAYAYNQLAGRNIDRVILIGNSHRELFPGWAIDDHALWQTPLGEIEVDLGGAQEIISKASECIAFNRQPHQSEHALEVQLPFLQAVIKNNFKIIPILFGNGGDEGHEILADAIKKVLRPGDIVIASSDLSHYLSYKEAVTVDTKTLKEILDKKIPAGDNILCGLEAVKVLELMARDFNWEIKLLKYANSGDTAGDKTAVVGYSAVAFSGLLPGNKTETAAGLNRQQQKLLLDLAKTSVETYIKTHRTPDFKISDPELTAVAGAFVTLTNRGQLRGCIGHIIGFQPLWQAVRDLAIAAATEDDRFLPIQEAELTNLHYEISVLSEPQLINNWQDINLGKDGVIVKKSGRTGVFLPQVATETGWNLEEFLAHLCADKAGLAPDAYKNDASVQIYTFTAQVF